MSETLLLKLSSPEPDEALSGEWLLWDTAQRRVLDRGAVELGEISEVLQQHSRNSPCVVLVPGERVSQLSVTLPIAGASAEAALPYQIEEKLSGELDSVHIAHEKIRAGVPCKVWVVSKPDMEQWSSWLQSSGLRVRAVLPDYAAFEPGVVFQDSRRSVAQLVNAAASLEHALFACWWTVQKFEDAPPLLLTTADAEISAEFASCERQEVASLLDASARHFSMPANNLCQGNYALHDAVHDTLAMVKWPALAALLVLVLHWALLAVSAIHDSQRAQQLDSAAEALYRETFPEARRVVNARSQMKSQLNALESKAGDGGLLPLLTKVSAAYTDQSAITVTQLVFQNASGNLRLAIDASNYAVIDTFSNKLQAQELEVSRGTFRQNGELISGQLNISKGAAQ